MWGPHTVLGCNLQILRVFVDNRGCVDTGFLCLRVTKCFLSCAGGKWRTVQGFNTLAACNDSTSGSFIGIWDEWKCENTCRRRCFLLFIILYPAGSVVVLSINSCDFMHVGVYLLLIWCVVACLQVLSRDHGYPLRAIVPGVIGARSVKWIEKIIVSEFECQVRKNRRIYCWP